MIGRSNSQNLSGGTKGLSLAPGCVAWFNESTNGNRSYNVSFQGIKNQVYVVMMTIETDNSVAYSVTDFSINNPVNIGVTEGPISHNNKAWHAFLKCTANDTVTFTVTCTKNYVNWAPLAVYMVPPTFKKIVELIGNTFIPTEPLYKGQQLIIQIGFSGTYSALPTQGSATLVQPVITNNFVAQAIIYIISLKDNNHLELPLATNYGNSHLVCY